MENYSGLIALAILIICLIIFVRYQTNKEDEDKEVEENKIVNEVKKEICKLDLNDEDAIVASLIASIECRNAYHKNVQVISVRKVG